MGSPLRTIISQYGSMALGGFGEPYASNYVGGGGRVLGYDCSYIHKVLPALSKQYLAKAKMAYRSVSSLIAFPPALP